MLKKQPGWFVRWAYRQMLRLGFVHVDTMNATIEAWQEAEADAQMRADQASEIQRQLTDAQKTINSNLERHASEIRDKLTPLVQKLTRISQTYDHRTGQVSIVVDLDSDMLIGIRNQPWDRELASEIVCRQVRYTIQNERVIGTPQQESRLSDILRGSDRPIRPSSHADKAYEPGSDL
jgi:hypothetical protein